MIERLQRIATLLARFRLPIFVLAGFSLIVLGLSVIENPWLNGDDLLMPSILGFCWALMLYSVSALFQHIPDQPGEEDGIRRRTSLRLRRLMLWLIGLLTLISIGGLIVLSYQLMRVWL